MATTPYYAVLVYRSSITLLAVSLITGCKPAEPSSNYTQAAPSPSEVLVGQDQVTHAIFEGSDQPSQLAAKPTDSPTDVAQSSEIKKDVLDANKGKFARVLAIDRVGGKIELAIVEFSNKAIEIPPSPDSSESVTARAEIVLTVTDHKATVTMANTHVLQVFSESERTKVREITGEEMWTQLTLERAVILVGPDVQVVADLRPGALVLTQAKSD